MPTFLDTPLQDARRPWSGKEEATERRAARAGPFYMACVGGWRMQLPGDQGRMHGEYLSPAHIAGSYRRLCDVAESTRIVTGDGRFESRRVTDGFVRTKHASGRCCSTPAMVHGPTSTSLEQEERWQNWDPWVVALMSSPAAATSSRTGTTASTLHQSIHR